MNIPKIRELPSGNWFVRLRLGGKSISKTFSTKEEAEAWATVIKQTHKVQSKAALNKKYKDKILGLIDESKEETTQHTSIPACATVLELVDNMDGYKFEEFCANLLIASGLFEGGGIHVTQKSADYGADLIIECLDGKRIAVQCKRQTGNVRIDAVQEVFASMNHYKADASMILTNSNFTKAAKNLAYDNGVVLISRKYLVKLIKIYVERLETQQNSSQWNKFLSKIGYV